MKTFNFDNGNQVFFTSDTHFGHESVLKFCHRPFDNVNEMDEELISRWNKTVGKDDFVFHLGDFAFGNSSFWVNTLKRLNGNIVLIKGNHDVKNYRETYNKYLLYVDSELFITVEGQSIYLNHYPFLAYAGVYRDNNPTWQLFGHVHMNRVKSYNTGKDFDRMTFLLPTQYDVGVDFHEYYPISFNFIRERIQSQIKNNVNQNFWIK